MRCLKFQYGRADCVTNLDKPYKAVKEERHSNPHANTDEILEDMKRDLDKIYKWADDNKMKFNLFLYQIREPKM